MDKIVILESVKEDKKNLEEALYSKEFKSKEHKKIVAFNLELCDIAETFFNTGIYNSHSMRSLNKKIEAFIKKKLSYESAKKYYPGTFNYLDYYASFQDDYTRTFDILKELLIEISLKEEDKREPYLFRIIKETSLAAAKWIEKHKISALIIIFVLIILTQILSGNQQVIRAVNRLLK